MKNFEEWNRQKIQIDNSNPNTFFREREIWMCALGENVGFEQSGKGKDFLRPVVVLRKFNPQVFLGVPLTSQKKEGKFYHRVPDIKGTRNSAILSQIKLIDVKRIKYRMAWMNAHEFEKLKKAICLMISG